jgi:hypothetical protein
MTPLARFRGGFPLPALAGTSFAGMTPLACFYGGFPLPAFAEEKRRGLSPEGSRPQGGNDVTLDGARQRISWPSVMAVG